MPELPEVETIRRGLAPHLVGRVLERVELLDQRLVQPFEVEDVAASLTGRTVEGLGRRDKYLLLHLDGGDVAIHHLRMTGSFSVADSAHEGAVDPGRHVRARYHVAAGDSNASTTVVRYHDPRRFGTLVVLGQQQAASYLDRRLGPEPFAEEFDGGYLHAQLQRRSASVKAVLLDQRVVAGIGNIYADEALFQAHIAPDSAANLVSRPAAKRLAVAIVDRLQTAIDAGGSTLRDYRNVEGEVGQMQEQFLVYGHAGEPCAACGRALRGGRVAGRGTVWCERCQPRARARR